MNWSLNQPQSQLYYDRHAQAAGAYASQRQPAASQKPPIINSIILIHRWIDFTCRERERERERERGRDLERETDPTIQMMTPTMERMRERKAKGRPRRNPKGRHSQSSPQHMASAFFFSIFFFGWFWRKESN